MFHNENNLQLTEMKLMMDLCKQMTMEAAPTGKLKKVPEHQPSSSSCTSLLGKETRRKGRPPNQPKIHVTERVPTFERPLQPPHFSYGDSQSQPKGSYVVRGSSLGLNFITSRGSEPVYYGVTKEMHRHSLAQKKVVVHENAVEPSKLKSQNGMLM